MAKEAAACLSVFASAATQPASSQRMRVPSAIYTVARGSSDAAANVLAYEFMRELAIPMTFLKFSRGFEKEADFLGLQYLYKSGYDPTSMITFFERIQAQQKRKKQTQWRGTKTFARRQRWLIAPAVGGTHLWHWRQQAHI